MAIAATAERRIVPVMASKEATHASSRAFFGVGALLFIASATATIAWCTSMASMPGMPMPGGWTMSMAWMRMPGQTWVEAAASFLAMWIVMMIAMMLPSLLPMLWRYRQAIARKGSAPLGLVALVAAGYFSVWTLLGLVVFPIGIVLAGLEMRMPAVSRAVPMLTAAVIAIAGVFQFTAWKTHHLACCRNARSDPGTVGPDAHAAWRHGRALGADCARCCANLMVMLLAGGVMNLWAMIAVTAAITAERVAPSAERVARSIGVAAIAAGLYLLARIGGFV